jgi:hypothetical protein
LNFLSKKIEDHGFLKWEFGFPFKCKKKKQVKALKTDRERDISEGGKGVRALLANYRERHLGPKSC